MLVSNPTASFTRPNDTTQYAIGDLVANSTTAASVTPMSFRIWTTGSGQTRITRARFVKNSISPTLTAFRLHLYQASPTCANGDNGAWSTDQAANYIGNIDGPTVLFAFSDGCALFGAAAAGSEMIVRLNAGSTIYGLLEARAAYTPVAQEIFTITLECLDSY